MVEKISVVCRNKYRDDYGVQYEYNSLFDYAISERNCFNQLANETLELDCDVELTDEQIKEVVRKSYEMDVFSEDLPEIGNIWKEQKFIDFDDPIVNGEDVAQSMFIAISNAWCILAEEVYGE